MISSLLTAANKLQNSRFRKAGSTVTRSSLSFEYGPSLAFAKNTAVLQSRLQIGTPFFPELLGSK